MSDHVAPSRVPLLVAAAAAVLGLLFFLSGGQDDCYITYGAARSLATTGRLTNYNGDALEQSSSLLHTALLAGLHRASGLGLPLLGWGLGIVAGVLLVVRSWTLCSVLGVRRRGVALALVATWPHLLFWWFGGLETTLAAWLLVELLLVLIVRRREEGGSWTRLLVVVAAWLTVRPEAGLVAGAALAVDAALTPGRRRRALEELAAVIGGSVLLGLFRLWQFGSLLPQPVLAKAGGSLLVKAIVGLIYWVETLHVPFGLLLALPLLALPWLIYRERDEAGRLVMLVVGAEAGFVTLSGGDWMVGGRFVATMASPVLVLAVRWLEAATLPPSPGRVLAGALALNLLGVVVFALQSATGRPLPGFLAARGRLAAAATAEPFSFVELANRVHLRDAVFLGGLYGVLDELLTTNDRVTVLSDQAGMVMFYVSARYGRRVELVDRYGLATTHFTAVAREAGIPPGLAGLRWDYPRFFALGRDREGACWQPDLIFDVGGVKLRQVRLAGYLPVYVQSGSDGRWTVVTEFAAVHPRHASRFPGPVREVSWESLLGEGESVAR